MMLSIIVGAVLILGGVAWMGMVYMGEGMRPTGGTAKGCLPMLYGVAAIVLGILLIVFR